MIDPKEVMWDRAIDAQLGATCRRYGLVDRRRAPSRAMLKVPHNGANFVWRNRMYNNYLPPPNPWDKRFQVKIGGCSLIFLAVLLMCMLSMLAHH